MKYATVLQVHYIRQIGNTGSTAQMAIKFNQFNQAPPPYTHTQAVAQGVCAMWQLLVASRVNFNTLRT